MIRCFSKVESILISPTALYFTQTDKNNKCPVCGHLLLQCKYTEAELRSMNKKKEEEHKERLEGYQDQPNNMVNSANRPRHHTIVQEFKCACIDVSGVYCPECKGEDDDCEVCNCQCTTAWMKKKEFQLISTQAQAKKNNMEENQAPKTVEQNMGAFGGMLQQCMAVSSWYLLYSTISSNITSLSTNIEFSGRTKSYGRRDHRR